MSGRGFLIAATNSRSGKTVFTMGLARALAEQGHNVQVAKSGPDYIDPAFHQAASGKPCVNLDGWAMSESRLRSLASGDHMLLIEGAMGLFDGASDGSGSSADLAKLLDIPVILLVNCASTSQSVAAIVRGFTSHDPDLKIAGVVLNNVGSKRHADMLQTALSATETPVLGILYRAASLARPSRHLGLVQAEEDPALEEFIETSAGIIAKSLDLDAIAKLATALPAPSPHARMPHLGQHIAIAKDAAFSFLYPHHLADWAADGVRVSYFSPLANEAPNEAADAIFLPGGYPELHAAALTRAGNFRRAMSDAAGSGKTIYGECGGYMVLGHTLTDARDIPHPMLGLLDLETSFSIKRLHLGYRTVTAQDGPLQGTFKAHEFHYATTLTEVGTPLFEAQSANGTTKMGLVSKNVSGSFAHIIDLA